MERRTSHIIAAILYFVVGFLIFGKKFGISGVAIGPFWVLVIVVSDIVRSRKSSNRQMRDVRRCWKPAGREGYRFTGQGSLMPLLTGMIPEFSQVVTSPSQALQVGASRLYLLPAFAEVSRV